MSDFTYQPYSSKEGIHYRSKNGKRVKPKLMTYKVYRDGKPVGYVERVETSAHRYNRTGRLITRTYHPLEWRWRSLDGRRRSPNRITWRTRQEAAIALYISE